MRGEEKALTQNSINPGIKDATLFVEIDDETNDIGIGILYLHYRNNEEFFYASEAFNVFYEDLFHQHKIVGGIIVATSEKGVISFFIKNNSSSKDKFAIFIEKLFQHEYSKYAQTNDESSINELIETQSGWISNLKSVANIQIKIPLKPIESEQKKSDLKNTDFYTRPKSTNQKPDPKPPESSCGCCLVM